MRKISTQIFKLILTYLAHIVSYVGKPAELGGISPPEFFLISTPPLQEGLHTEHQVEIGQYTRIRTTNSALKKSQ